MNLKNNDRKWLLPVGSVLVAAIIVVAAWYGVGALRADSDVETISVVSFSMAALYSTLEDLTEDADAVILGTVREIAQTGISRGKEGNGTANPHSLYEIEVLESFKGDASGAIYVSRTDPSFLENTVSIRDVPLTKPQAGETVVLYLHRMSADIEPTITMTDTTYVLLSFDNGVFDVSGAGPVGPVGRVNDAAEILPRSIHNEMFTAGSLFTAADIRQAIEPDSGADGPVGNTN